MTDFPDKRLPGRIIKLFDGIPNKTQRARFILEWMAFSACLARLPDAEDRIPDMVELLAKELDCESEALAIVQEMENDDE